MNPKIDEYINRAKNWKEEMSQLRQILLECGLTEELKWGNPCYMHGKSNLIMLYSLKESAAISFFKGVLLKDPKQILLKPGENSQSGRWVKFTDKAQIKKLTPVLKSYIKEAIALEDAGAKVEFNQSKELDIPVEFQDAMKKQSDLKKAFFALTPGRQRAYVLFFNGAKQSETRKTRIEKYTAQILSGKGINDCTCGLSKKLPACDGSHKMLK